MSFTIPQELPGLYDLGIETRDGSVLACKDRNGRTINLSRLGVVGMPGEDQTWSTELQEKSKLVQLQPAISDREFDQWVQYSQGDWSGGQGVRVAPTGSVPSTYYDGQGLIWPQNDWQPQQPYDAGAIATPAGAGKGPGGPVGVVGGYLGNATGEFGYAYTYSAGTHFYLNIQGAANQYQAADPYGVVGQAALAMVIGGGSLWTITQSGSTTNISLWRHDISPPTTILQANPANIITDALAAYSVPTSAAQMAVGLVNSKLYVAASVTYQSNAAGNPYKTVIAIVDMTTPATPALTTLTLPVLSNQALPLVTQIGFQGGNLIAAVTDGQTTSIMSYSFSSSSWSTLMQIPGSRAYFTVVGGALFILNSILTSNEGSTNITAVDMYSLVGGTLAYLGSIPPYSTAIPSPSGVCQPSTWGPYAVFAASFSSDPRPGGLNFPVLYAYDLLRSRFFKVWVGPTSYTNSLGQGVSLAIIGPSRRTSGVGTPFRGQWGVVVPLILASNQVYAGEELWFGVQGNPDLVNQTTIVQGPTSLTSSVVDYTSSQNKLFRQLVCQLTQAMPNDSNVGVTINVWIDKDLSNLGAADLTLTIYGNDAVNPQAQTIYLPLNRVGKKLVYQVITLGGGYVAAAWRNAPKLQSVIIQSGVGWVVDYRLSFARNTRTNAAEPNDFVWERQGVDEVAAANFLRNLWRLKGGLCKVTLPNSDSYNAVIQVLGGKSKKMFPTSDMGADDDTRWEQEVAVRIREDI